MKNFCAKCGNKLNENLRCDKCNAPTTEPEAAPASNLTEKVKNFDYKGAADNLKAKATDFADMAKGYELNIKSNKKSKLKWVICAVIVIILLSLIITGVMKIRQFMCLSPEAAVANYFNKIESIVDIGSLSADEDDKSIVEIAKTITTAIDYKVLAVDEKEDTATAIIEIKAIDMDAVTDTLSAYLKDPVVQANNKSETALLLEALKKNKNNKIKETVTIELSESDSKWSIDSTDELEEALLGGII